MKISTILDHIDNGHMALPEFQRGYVWNRDQVRGLFDSLYRRHPVGGLLVWATESKTATHRGDGVLAAGVVKLLLDGQQRMTALYGVVRGRAPKCFDGNAQAVHGTALSSGDGDLRVLPAGEDEGRSTVDRRDRADAEAHCRAGRVRQAPHGATGAGGQGRRVGRTPEAASRYRRRGSARRGKSPARTSRSTWWSTSSTGWTGVAPSSRRATLPSPRSAPSGLKGATR